MRRANGALKAAGMCCAMTIAGESAGRPVSNSRIASVPPVEEPTATMRSVVRSMRAAACAGRMASAECLGTWMADGAMRASTRAPAAMRILPRISSLKLCSVPATSTLGLETKSTAPSSSAFSVVSAPRSVSEDTMTTGMGRSRMRLARNVSPSMRGISTSSVSTSGLVSLIFSRATKGSRGRAHHFHVGGGLQDLDQDLAHQCRVVDDQDFDFAFHGRLSPRRAGR